MARHESRCDRQYARAHNRLFELQYRRKNKNRASEPGKFSQIAENRDLLKLPDVEIEPGETRD